MEHAVWCEDLTLIDERSAFEDGCWTLELVDAVNGARDGRYAFYVVVDGRRVDLVADAHADGEAFLRPARGSAGVGVLPLPRLGALDRAYARPVSAR